jgi:hypothetical protein
MPGGTVRQPYIDVPTRQTTLFDVTAHQAGGIISLESIPRLLKRLQIRALLTTAPPIPIERPKHVGLACYLLYNAVCSGLFGVDFCGANTG